MSLIGPLLLLGMIVGAGFILIKLHKEKRKRMLVKADSSALDRLTPLRRAHWEKQPHISYKDITEWAEGKLDGDFLDRMLAGEWRLHVDACTSCQEIIEYFRAERKKKTMSELNEGLQN